MYHYTNQHWKPLDHKSEQAQAQWRQFLNHWNISDHILLHWKRFMSSGVMVKIRYIVTVIFSFFI